MRSSISRAVRAPSKRQAALREREAAVHVLPSIEPSVARFLPWIVGFAVLAGVFTHRASPFALRGAEAIDETAAAPSLPPSPPPSASPRPSQFPAASCEDFQATLATSGTTLLQQVTVEGVTPRLQMYLLSHAPEAPLEIEAAMTRTEAMMAAAYKKILLDPYWSGARGFPSASTVLEVGVHGGWFATLAHKFGGHRVVGFDMQPYCVLVARCALQVNGATSAYPVILNRYVSHGEATVDVSDSSCGGGLGVGNRARGAVAVHPVHLGRFFDAGNLASLNLDADFEIPILKSDTEGFEGVVLETALPLLGRIHNVLLEVFGIRWKMHNIAESRVLAVFECLHAAGMNEMVDLPRRDIDFIVPGDIDLDNLPSERLHKTWEAWRAQLSLILAEKNGLINPNLWLRWGDPQKRKSLDLSKVPQCQASLAQSSYTPPAVPNNERCDPGVQPPYFLALAEHEAPRYLGGWV